MQWLMLSRLSINAIHTWASVPIVDFQAMAAAQAGDPGVRTAHTESSLWLEQVPLSLSDGATLLVDMSTGLQRPVVPEHFHQQIFDVLHSLSHSDITATQRLITTFCLAGHQHGRATVVSCLFAMSACQSPSVPAATTWHLHQS